MIRFLVVKPKQAIEDSYITNLIDILNEPTNSIECLIYDNKEADWKVKIDGTNNSGTFFANFSLNTYDGVAQLIVFIEPQRVEPNFNNELHRIKVLIKDTLLKQWEKCVWLYDEQSIYFAEILYGRMYRVENLLRSVISNIMVTHIGIEWWEKLAPLQLKETYQKRVRGYKSLTKDFKNVDDFLLAIDTDHLKNIMTHTTKEWTPSYDSEIESLLERDNQADYGRIMGLLKKQLKNKQNLWDTLFRNYFKGNPDFEESISDTIDFLEAWDEYCKYRNHIAHNKLLDFHAFELIKNNVNLVESLIIEADKRFQSSKVSDEQKREAHELIMEFELEQRMYDAAGVKVYSEDRIQQIMQKLFYQFALDIEEEINRLDLESTVEDEPISIPEKFSSILQIESKIDETKIIVQVKTEEVSGDAGETSVFLVQLVNSEGEAIEDCKVEWRNGNAEWSAEDGFYKQTTKEYLDDEELNLLKENILENLDHYFTNYIDELDSGKYASIKDGDKYPICNDVCENCGELTVSIDDNILSYGTCASCGYENEISTCMRCDEEFIGTSDICESCQDYIDAE